MVLDLNLETPALGLLEQPAIIFFNIARVDTDKKSVFLCSIDDQIIHHSAFSVAHGRVDGFANRYTGHGID